MNKEQVEHKEVRLAEKLGVIIYLTYLALAGAAWGGVTGREVSLTYSDRICSWCSVVSGLPPIWITRVPGFISSRTTSPGIVATFFPSSHAASASPASGMVPGEPSACRVAAYTLTPKPRLYRLRDGPISAHPALFSPVANCQRKVDTSLVEYPSAETSASMTYLVPKNGRMAFVNFVKSPTERYERSCASSETLRFSSLDSEFDSFFSRLPYTCLPISEMTNATQATSLDRFIPNSSRTIATTSDAVSRYSKTEFIASTVLSDFQPGRNPISQFGMWALIAVAATRLVGLIWKLAMQRREEREESEAQKAGKSR